MAMTEVRGCVELNCLFLCFYVVSSFKKKTSSKFADFVLFRPIKKRSFNFLCVLDLF